MFLTNLALLATAIPLALALPARCSASVSNPPSQPAPPPTQPAPNPPPTETASSSSALYTSSVSKAPAPSTIEPSQASSSAPPPASTLPAPTPSPISTPCYAKWKQQDYTANSTVSSNGNNYHNKYYTNTEPSSSGTDSAWVSEGPCDAASLSFRPFTSPGVIGYWANWAGYTRPQNNLDKMDLSGFSAVNYAFLNALADGSLKSFDSFADGKHVGLLNGAVRNKYPSLRTTISIGGWSGSRYFSTIAANAATIQTFVKNVHQYLDENGFDAVDIDWEHPGGGGLACNTVDPQDAKNYAALLAALRTELGPTRAISIAVSADINHYIVDGVNYANEYAKSINYFQVMTYDFYGSWSPFTDFNSPLNSPGPNDPQQPSTNSKNGTQFSIAGAMQAFMDAGIPKSQLVPGLAFYGRSWEVPATPENNGLYQPCAGTKLPSGACTPIIGDVLDATTFPDACGDTYHSTVWMYSNMRGSTGGSKAQDAPPLAGGPTTASNGWTRKYFDFAETPTLFHPAYNGQPTFISYDDPQSIKAKSAWAKHQGFAGVMVWELDEDHEGEMVGALKEGWSK
ncbi:hypothetical protein HDU78_007225 [Chytriomyces hyalinus]|nr:hypothetical protein HDU78_007225 [Chytriomyces hyalinus]